MVKMIGSRIAAIDTRAARPPDKQADPFYLSQRYREWREAVIARARGYCQDPKCKTPNRKPSRLFADHVVEVKDGGAPYDEANGLARCGSCHTRKTNEERAKRLTG